MNMIHYCYSLRVNLFPGGIGRLTTRITIGFNIFDFSSIFGHCFGLNIDIFTVKI